MSGIPEQDLDERTAEALLSGSLAPHEAPPGWERVAALLRAAGREVPGDGPPPRLLAPEQEALVPQILELKLEGARLALLATDAAAFRDLTAGSRQWLLDYYNGSDPSVRAALADLERLSRLDLTPALPDITRSLTLLRAHLQASPQ